MQVQPWQPAGVPQRDKEGGRADLHSVCQLAAGAELRMERPCCRITTLTCRMCLLRPSCGGHPHCCLLHMQAVKLGVSRKQGDTSWGATYIFPVLVRTEFQRTTLSGFCVTLRLDQCNGTTNLRPVQALVHAPGCRDCDDVDAGGGRLQAQRLQGAWSQLSAWNVAAGLRAPEHHALMLYMPCAGGCNSARHTRRRWRCEAASDVGAHSRDLRPSWSRAVQQESKCSYILVQCSSRV